MPAEPAWLTVESDGQQTCVRLDLALTTIGRNDGNVVDLSDKRLSRFHCEIGRRGANYFVRDCASRNGTRVNGTAITAEHALVDSDTIEIGNSRLVFRVERPVDAGSHDQLVPIRPVGRAFREAGTSRIEANAMDSAEDLTPSEAFDPRSTIAVPPLPPRVSVFVLERWRRLIESIRLMAEVASSEQVLARLVDSTLDLVPARQALVVFPAAEPGGPLRVLVQRPQPAGAPFEPRFSSGVVEDVLRTGHPVSVEELRSSSWADDVSVLGLGLNGALAVPLRALGRPRGVLYVDDPEHLPALEREDALAFLGALADAAGVSLLRTGGERFALSGESGESGEDARVAAEAARALRRAGETLPPAAGLDLACRLVPSRGAFIEVASLPERAGRRELALLVGTRSGTSLEAACLEAAARAAFRALARSVGSASVLLSALEDALRPELEGRTLCATVLRLDPLACELNVASAGLGPLVHRRAGGTVSASGGAGTPLGASSPEARTERSIAWAPGDLVLVVAPGTAGLQAASWLGGTGALDARATLERLGKEQGRDLSAAFAVRRLPG